MIYGVSFSSKNKTNPGITMSEEKIYFIKFIRR